MPINGSGVSLRTDQIIEPIKAISDKTNPARNPKKA
jgi:hypothetical protein